MNRRQLLARLAAAGLVAGVAEAERRWWALGGLPDPEPEPWFLETGRFDASLPSFEKVIHVDLTDPAQVAMAHRLQLLGDVRGVRWRLKDAYLRNVTLVPRIR